MGGGRDVTGPRRYRVVLSIPWIVKGVQGTQDAINVAVSEVGARISAANAAAVSGCNITVQTVGCPACGTRREAVLVVEEIALVGLTLRCTVTAASADAAARAARRELGTEFEGVPLVPLDTIEDSETGS